MKLDPEMKLSQLSRGMREKLIIALTFARKADLYLLDEPFGGIDAMARRKLLIPSFCGKMKRQRF